MLSRMALLYDMLFVQNYIGIVLTKLGRTPMRKLVVVLAATAAVLLAGSLAFKADAQTSRGAANISAETQNFTPIEKAACGPHWGRWCGPYHHRVCGPAGRCWCAHC
jgi:hypothetical protein